MNKVLERLLDREECFLATASARGVPENAVINFAAAPGDAMPVLYFETLRRNRKYWNLAANGQASIVLYDPSAKEAAQLEGAAVELHDDELAAARALLERRYGQRALYAHPDIAYFKFTPHFIRVQRPGWPPKYTTIGERR